MAEKATPSVPKIEIEELREAGSDGGGLMGYFCRGHVGRYDFAQAANHYSGALDFYDIRHVKPERSFHVWWRTVKVDGDPGQFEFRSAEPGARGAWRATVCESVVERTSHNTRQFIKAEDRGYARGVAMGANWAIHWLEAVGQHDLSRRMVEAYRGKRSEIEKNPDV